jgi:hypothetical protein
MIRMDAKRSLRKLEVQLSVDHDKLSAVELSELLGELPDQSWNVGQRYNPGGNAVEQKYRFSRWAISVIASSLDDLDNAILELTARVERIERKFGMLPNDARVNLTLFITETNTVIGMGIDNRFVALLGRIGAGFEVSLLFAQPERV